MLATASRWLIPPAFGAGRWPDVFATGLASAGGGNQTDTDFDESHVRLARRDDARAGHRHFRAAAEHSSERRRHHRLRAEAHLHESVLHSLYASFDGV